MKFENDDQLKSFLKSESKRLGISITNTYNTFFARLLLERINNVRKDMLFVKGSFSELAHTRKLVRPITDVDLVSTDNHNEPLITLFRALYDTNDDIKMELNRLPYQTNTGIYKIHIDVHFGKICHPMSIDYQESSKTVYEKELKIINPIFKGDYPFVVCTPPIEAYIAEKLCIVLENSKQGVLNTRVKDFYDIWKLLECEYNANKLEQIFCRMIEDRQKCDVNNLSTDFLNKDYVEKHYATWDNIKQKYEFLDDRVEFGSAVRCAKVMLDHEVEYYQRVRKKR